MSSCVTYWGQQLGGPTVNYTTKEQNSNKHSYSMTTVVAHPFRFCVTT